MKDMSIALSLMVLGFAVLVLAAAVVISGATAGGGVDCPGWDETTPAIPEPMEGIMQRQSFPQQPNLPKGQTHE